MRKIYILLLKGFFVTTISCAQNTAWPSATSTDNVGIGTLFPASKLTVSPNGGGGVLIGNPNTGAGGFTSLLLHISENQNGYSFLQCIKSAGSSYGLIALNPDGGKVGIGK